MCATSNFKHTTASRQRDMLTAALCCAAFNVPSTVYDGEFTGLYHFCILNLLILVSHSTFPFTPSLGTYEYKSDMYVYVERACRRAQQFKKMCNGTFVARWCIRVRYYNVVERC